MNWFEYFIGMANYVRTKSKDPSVQVGCVIVGPNNEVLSTGYNGFPRGVDETKQSRWVRPEKYQWIEHAERNAIYNAARCGIKLEGATLFLPWEPIPCSDCARAVVQAGIKRVIGTSAQFPSSNPDKWREDAKIASQILFEGGVEQVYLDTDFNVAWNYGGPESKGQ